MSCVNCGTELLCPKCEVNEIGLYLQSKSIIDDEVFEKLKQQNEKMIEILDAVFSDKPIIEQVDSIIFKAKEILKEVKGE